MREVSEREGKMKNEGHTLDHLDRHSRATAVLAGQLRIKQRASEDVPGPPIAQLGLDPQIGPLIEQEKPGKRHLPGGVHHGLVDIHNLGHGGHPRVVSLRKVVAGHQAGSHGAGDQPPAVRLLLEDHHLRALGDAQLIRSLCVVGVGGNSLGERLPRRRRGRGGSWGSPKKI